MNYYVYNRPAGTVSEENPARFTWMPKEDAKEYQIEVYDAAGVCRYQYDGIDINFYTPDHIMEPGSYTYRILADGSELVKRMSFEIPKDACETPLTGRPMRYQSVTTHPRIWIGREKLNQLRQDVKSEVGDIKETWDAFAEKGAEPWLTHGVISEPKRYPEDKRIIKLWRQMYTDCQEALYRVKHCAVAWQVTGDERYLQTAKTQLLNLAAWDTDGPTARSYNDEAAFRVTTALAWGYDWLYEALTPAERDDVKAALLIRGRELYDYVRNQIQIHIRLLDSHGVRSLSMTLVPAALALLGEEEEAQEWLNYTIEYFFTIFTPWGGADVDPAETTGMPVQWHITAATANAQKSHRIVSVLYPYREGEKESLQVLADNDITIKMGDRVMTVTEKQGGYYLK